MEKPESDAAPTGFDLLARRLAALALQAGPAIMDIYGRCEAKSKSDGSPVTLADERAEAIIKAGLAEIEPETPVVAEEAVAGGAAMVCGARFFLVDPLDGTREFLARNGEFTVNIALVVEGAPVAGAVYAPAIDKLWFAGSVAYACKVGVGEALPDPASWRRISARSAPASLVALASRSHADPATEAFLARLPIAERKSAGSSLKFCVLAEGEADIYPRFAPTMEWDTAAGEAVLRAAGGVVLQTDGSPFHYGKLDKGLKNGGFVAWGDPAKAVALNVRNS